MHVFVVVVTMVLLKAYQNSLVELRLRGLSVEKPLQGPPVKIPYVLLVGTAKAGVKCCAVAVVKKEKCSVLEVGVNGAQYQRFQGRGVVTTLCLPTPLCSLRSDVLVDLVDHFPDVHLASVPLSLAVADPDR